MFGKTGNIYLCKGVTIRIFLYKKSFFDTGISIPDLLEVCYLTAGFFPFQTDKAGASYMLTLFAMCTPYILIFMVSMWKSYFGNFPFPGLYSIIVVCINLFWMYQCDRSPWSFYAWNIFTTEITCIYGYGKHKHYSAIVYQIFTCLCYFQLFND